MDKALLHLRNSDEVLAWLIEKVGPFTIKKSNTYYEDLISIIISQQLSYKAASTIKGRFQELIKEDYNPEKVLNISSEKVRAVGISESKLRSIRALSEVYISQREKFSQLDTLADFEVCGFLESINGLGKWSSSMFLIFSLNRLNVFPYDDIGFKNSLRKNYGLKRMPSSIFLNRMKKKWDPFNSVAVWYFWQSINLKIFFQRNE